MGVTQYYLAQSLDGYIAETDGGIDWLTGYEGEKGAEGPMSSDDGYDKFIADVGALAMGSATYDFLLGLDTWPYEGLPTWVFTSRDLPVPDGADVRFANGPVRPVHEEMVAAAGDQNVWMIGGGDLAQQFADEDLLDELIVTVVPVVLGTGLPTFAGRLAQNLRLTGTHPFPNGMVELRYEFLRGS